MTKAQYYSLLVPLWLIAGHTSGEPVLRIICTTTATFISVVALVGQFRPPR